MAGQLGSRTGVRAFFTDHFVLPLPAGHRFPMEKYEKLRRRIIADAVLVSGDLEVPHAATDAELGRAHEPDYIQMVQDGRLSLDEMRRIGFPWSDAMVERSRRSVGGTIGACRAALDAGVSFNLAGGTHHAFAGRGEGYCVFNDAAVAARAMQAEGRASQLIIIDCDVHQGNGTASIFADDRTVFTFDIYAAHNFPFEKAEVDYGIALNDAVGDEEYLSALATGLERVLTVTRPDLAIYLAGADPFVDDWLGRLSLSRAGLAERDRLVFQRCGADGVPVATVMAGGYARNVDDTVSIHAQTVATGLEHWKPAVCRASLPSVSS